MKKFITLVLAIVLIVSTGIYASCGNKDDGKIHVSFYHTMGANLREKLDKYVAKFNQQYPNISIDAEQIGSYDDVRDQIITELQVGNQPAIAYCYPDHVAAYLRSKKVIDLNTYINSSDPEMALTTEQVSDFITGYYQEGQQFGDTSKMYSLPFSKSTEVMYYNKTFFEANGLSVPQTWDELETVITRIKEIDPNSAPLGYDSEANWFITMTEQLKTPYTAAATAVEERFLFNSEQNIQFLSKFRTWYSKGLMTTQKIYGGYTSGLFTNLKATDDKILRSYISIGSSAGATYQCPEALDDGSYPFEVGIAPIPQADLNNKKVISQGPSVCLFKQKDPEVEKAAWLFMKFLLTNPNFQAEFSMASGYVPVLKSTFDVPEYREFLAEAGYTKETIAALSAKVCMEQEEYYFTSPAFVGSTDARDQVGAVLVAAIQVKSDDTKAIKDLLDEAVQKCITLNK